MLATAFLYTYKEAFIAYAFTNEEMKLNGAKRSHQRFEQCIHLLEENAHPALKALEASHFFDPAIQKGVAYLAATAIRDYREEVLSKIPDDNIRTKILRKIDLIKLIVMFPNDVLNISKSNEIYENLELDGTESFVKMYVELKSYRNSIDREAKHSWIKVLFNLLEKELDIYDPNTNILCKLTTKENYAL